MCRQPDDAAREAGGHFLGHLKLQTSQFETEAAGSERHGGGHACAERSGHQIGGRKTLAAALIVAWSIGHEAAAGRTVVRDAMKIALIFASNFDNEALLFWLFCGAKQRHKRQKSRKGEKNQA